MRYIDLFMYFVSMYNTCMKVFFIGSSALIIYAMRFKKPYCTVSFLFPFYPSIDRVNSYRLMILLETISHISKSSFHPLPFLPLSFTQVSPHGSLSGVTVYGLKLSLLSHKLWCWTKSELWRISPLTTLQHLDSTDSFTFLTGFTDGRKTVSSAGLKF